MRTVSDPHDLARLALAGLTGGLAALGLYAALVEPRRLQVRRSAIHHRGLHPDLEGFRIAVLSDFHAGRLTPPAVIRRAVRQTLAERPHLIALPGDFLDRRPHELEQAFRYLRGLRAPYGVFAVPGNHDRKHFDLAEWRAAVARHPTIRDIANAHVLLKVGRARLCVAGIDDLQRGHPRLHLPSFEDRDLTLLLAHNPDQAERSRRAVDAVDLVLSGHTHGGQIRIPHLGAIHRKSNIYDHGLRRRPWTQVYTSRGIGTTALPVRLAAPPEVAILTLTGRPREAW
ncbi:MAG: metallophosphoesterase [Gemmatimonadota bacterium]